MVNIKDKINNILEEIKKTSQGEEIVVAFSGGLDSTVVSALAIQTLGRKKVEAITVSFEEYSYSKGLRNIQDISRTLDLKLKIIQGKREQERVLKKGPACNKCTRVAK
ncbi:MAG: 7-cyano-7-deazaguanine synthase, partial [Atribacterota bacterium]|nr:7-cyano-7-deazaguanine synthase [Atribacterota bacterium]